MEESSLNVAVLERVAEWLDAGAPPEKMHGMSFGMKYFLIVPQGQDINEENWCGTTCCIGGALATMSDEKLPDGCSLTDIDLFIGRKYVNGDFVAYDLWDVAMDVAGLDPEQATDLFTPWGSAWRYDDDCWPTSIGEASDPRWAARTIRHLIKTGVADWGATKDAVSEALAEGETECSEN